MRGLLVAMLCAVLCCPLLTVLLGICCRKRGLAMPTLLARILTLIVGKPWQHMRHGAAVLPGAEPIRAAQPICRDMPSKLCCRQARP
jgi:hypothetical protein